MSKSDRLRRPGFGVRSGIALASLVMGATALGGCGGPVLGLFATAVLPEEVKVKVPADYRGLDGQVVAVMVNLNEYAYSQHPGAPSDLCWAVSKDLRANVPGINVINPDELIRFQEDNPYWNTLRYAQLIERLKVDRIVLIDVLQYGTHEPGNQYVLQGVIVGDVKVIEASKAATPDAPTGNDNLAYSKTVEARFPKDNPIGLVNGDERTVEVATLAQFSRNAGYLFYDHIEMRKR